MKMDQALEHAFRQSGDLEQFTRQVHTWFDAFRTLKLIHALRDSELPSISYATLMADPLYQHLLTIDPDLLGYHARLTNNPVKESMHGKGVKVPALNPITDRFKDVSNV
jgi:hypothetical protein